MKQRKTMCFLLLTFVFSVPTFTQQLAPSLAPTQLQTGIKDMNSTVCLFHEWEMPVEQILSTDQLFSLIPKRNDDINNKGSQNNIFFAIYRNECKSDIKNPFFVGANYQIGPGILHLASMNINIYPNILSEWSITNNCSIFVWIPYHTYYSDISMTNVLNDQSMRGFSEFINSNRPVSLTFINNYETSINLYWFEEGESKLSATYEVGHSGVHNTFLGHIFYAVDSNNEYLIDYWVAHGNDNIYISKLDYCDNLNIPNPSKECHKAMEEELWSWANAFWARKRESLNHVQPSIVPNFTETGFTFTKMDSDTFSIIFNFWKNAKKNNNLQLETLAGPVLNQKKSPTYMAHLPGYERQVLEEWLRSRLEKWSGLNDLYLTSLYGIRMYTRDAVLAMHVDTCRTHVISAIVNVDSKLDSGKDWPLQIYDHYDNLHEISMKPGDVVFYESARNGHARFKPLEGEYYANVFIHFRPNDNSHWDFDWF